jgi:hypothetical protein
MRASEAILAIVCAGLALACVPAAQSQEATSASLPDGFRPRGSAPASKTKNNNVGSTSRTLATAPKQTVAPALQQPSPVEELATIVTTQEKDPEPSAAVEANTNVTSARVTKNGASFERNYAGDAAVEKKALPKKRPRAAVQTEATPMSGPVAKSLSVAQSIASVTRPVTGSTVTLALQTRNSLPGSGTDQLRMSDVWHDVILLQRNSRSATAAGNKKVAIIGAKKAGAIRRRRRCAPQSK